MSKPAVLLLSVLLVTLAGLGHAADAVDPRVRSGTKIQLEHFQAEDKQVAQAAEKYVVPALQRATSLELLSLWPSGFIDPRRAIPRFHGYAIVGRTPIRDKETIVTVRETLVASMAPGAPVLCFNPRHGIRTWSKQFGTVDFLVCFQCGQVEIHGLPRQKPDPFIQFLEKPTEDLLSVLLDSAHIERIQ